MKKLVFGLIAIFFINCNFCNAQKISNNDFNPKGTQTEKIIIDIARKKHSADPSQCGDCICGLGICRFCFFAKKELIQLQKY